MGTWTSMNWKSLQATGPVVSYKQLLSTYKIIASDLKVMEVCCVWSHGHPLGFYEDKYLFGFGNVVDVILETVFLTIVSSVGSVYN